VLIQVQIQLQIQVLIQVLIQLLIQVLIQVPIHSGPGGRLDHTGGKYIGLKIIAI
jgi:hypothetical protein